MIAFNASRWMRRALAAVGMLVSLAPMAQAHPHIFIKQHVVALFDQSGFAGFRLTWRFDPLYSSMMRADFVSSKTGPLSAADVKTLHDKSFVDLKNEHYFTTVTFNGKSVPLGVPTDFSAAAVDDSIVYTFVVPLKPDPHDIRVQNTLEITIFDPSYYVYYELAEADPVKTTGGTTLGAACRATVVWRESIGWGRVHSDLVTCSYHAPR